MLHEENYKGYQINIIECEDSNLDSPLDIFQGNYNAEIIRDRNVLKRYLNEEETRLENYWFVQPVYAYEHGELLLSTTPYNIQWDSYPYAIVAIKKSIKDCTIEDILRDLEVTLSSQNKFSQGEVFGFQIIDPKNDDEIDSCWGYIGYDQIKDIINECHSTIDNYIASLKTTYTLSYWYRTDLDNNIVKEIENVYSNKETAMNAYKELCDTIHSKVKEIYGNSNIEVAVGETCTTISENNYTCGGISIVEDKHKIDILPKNVYVCMVSNLDNCTNEVEVYWTSSEDWNTSVKRFKHTCSELSTDDTYGVLKYIVNNDHNEKITIDKDTLECRADFICDIDNGYKVCVEMIEKKVIM